jgi:hypothetical protein
MNNVIDCVSAVQQALEKYNVVPGQITHSLAQLETVFQQEARGFIVSIEQQTARMGVPSGKGGGVDIARNIDVVAEDLVRRIHTEIKSGKVLSEALNINQLTQDAALAIHNVMEREAGQTAKTLENVWRFSNIRFGDELPSVLQTRVQSIVQRLTQEGFSPEHIRAAISSFNFVDAAGKVIRAELSTNGELLFHHAMVELFGPEGKVAQAATKAAGSSPDFTPAMTTIFGASGKMADAATHAATGTNLDPALQNLEQKLEKGVNGALDQAGTKAAEHAGQALGKKIGEGATSLGNVLTSIPQLYDQVTKLGEAWDKPHKSTKDYMDLMSAAGGVLTQGVQTIQALSGVTQIATGVQAAFNAVAAMNPYVLIVIAVIALIAAIVLLIVYWDQVKAALRDNPWLAVIAVMFGVIGIIVLVIAYWDEIKLAVLQAANFISIQVQKIGLFFVGLKNLVGMVWDWIVATVENVGISIVNAFITIGVSIQNFFIGIINWILDQYNAIADSALGKLVGLEKAAKIPEVQLETKLIPPKEVPKVDVEAAFKTGPITGGLEDQIAKQEAVVAKAKAEDEERQRKAKEAQPPTPAPGAPAVPGLPLGAALPPASVAAPPEAGGLARPGLPTVGAGAAPAGGPVDQSVHVDGGITVNINAERLEADAAQILSDEIINAIASRLDALRSQQNFRTGVLAPAPAGP